MTTIVRVKRHRAEGPVEALVLSCKRKRTEESDSDSDLNLFEKVFNFSGTVEDKNNKVATSVVQSFNKESKYSNFNKNHTPEIRLKQRQERKERSDENRFMLLSCLRSSNEGENSEVDASGDSKQKFTIVDISKASDQKLAEHGTNDGSYVYDLYSIPDNDSDFNDIHIENLLSIQPIGSELEFRNREDCYEEIDPDDDDSNDENNWRNDYPDTGSSMDEDEDDILSRQLKGCHLESEDCNLSDDSGEEKYLNYGDEENYHYYEAEDLAGKRYAKYKANAMKQLIDDNEEGGGDSSESDDDFLDCEVLSYHGDSD